jgi:hypothetical protein
MRAAALLLGLAGASPTRAQENSVPSCYAHVRIGVQAPVPGREVFILVDQTTALDGGLAANLRDNLRNLVQPGTSFTVSAFSAFSRGHFTTVVASGLVEAPVQGALRNSLPVNRLKQLDQCIVAQTGFAQRKALEALGRAMAPSAGSFANSEIMTSLAQLAERVRASRARDRVVVVASDMLEHSTVTSFYARRTLRRIDAGAEIRRAQATRQIGNFGGARVYVIGAALLPPGPGGGAVRDIDALNALQSFWANWFRLSNARLVAFGRPNLVTPVR